MSGLHARTEPVRDAALAGYARRRFGAHLKSASEDQLRQAVREARRLASGWRIFAERDVATVLDLAVMYGGDFGAADWAGDILEASDRDGAQKAEALRARVRRTIPAF